MIRNVLQAAVRNRTYNVLVEKDEDEYYVASVIELPGCHTQAKTLDQLYQRAREAIMAYLQVSKVGKEANLSAYSR